MKKIIKIKPLLLSVLLVVMMAPPTKIMAAEDTVNLGTTSTFAVLAGSTITNTGKTTISGKAGGEVDGNVGGDVGLYPGTAFTGDADVTINDGNPHIKDYAAMKAQKDLITAYDDAAGRTPTKTIPAELGGQTLTPGVYKSEIGSFAITGDLTLDAQGDPNAVFIFQADSSLGTATDSNVYLINSARFCRTFWKVGSSATLGVNSNFAGHILAMESITAANGAIVQGQLLARNGAVTLEENTITNGYCEKVIPDPQKATIKIIKHVINDNGGTRIASDFNIHIKTSGTDVDSSPASGTESGKTYTVDAGDYVISEDNFDGYTPSYSVDSDSNGKITLQPGDNKIVTITNDDVSPILHVIKYVTNDNGGTKIDSDFKLIVKTSSGNIVSSEPGTDPTGNTYVLSAGTYGISEEDFAGYKLIYSGDGDSSGTITLKPGDNKTVIITNDDIAVTTPVPGGTVVNPPVQDGTVVNPPVQDGTVVNPPVPGGTVVNPPVQDGTVVTAPVQDGTVVTAPVQDGTVVNPPVQDGTIATPNVSSEAVTTTVTGGQLPKTSTPMYGVLLFGAVLTLLGAIGWRCRKQYE
ncbi:ice-binding family protein [Clostridium lacusfryxellense]|uniref:ice-binding family protein n=1 Tax=Clostridium lacusfryxellense TaxID=205328 RepID=UPI001C0B3A3F|nr:ice-binding family protein [Clostridium lacusfryxellense]MBU3113778.1 DUF3494 domain-containing protein [Clostridium lacusfryxellense]